MNLKIQKNLIWGVVLYGYLVYLAPNLLAEERQFGGKVKKMIPCICNGQHNGSNADVYIEVGKPHGNENNGTGKYMITTSTRRYDYEPVMMNECALGMKKQNAEEKECWIRVYQICVLAAKGKEVDFYGSSSTADCDISGKPLKNTSTSPQTAQGYVDSKAGGGSGGGSNAPSNRSNSHNNFNKQSRSQDSANSKKSDNKNVALVNSNSSDKQSEKSGNTASNQTKSKNEKKNDDLDHQNNLKLQKKGGVHPSIQKKSSEYDIESSMKKNDGNVKEKKKGILDSIGNFNIQEGGILDNLRDFMFEKNNISMHNQGNDKTTSIVKSYDSKGTERVIKDETFIQKVINTIIKYTGALKR